MHDEMKETQQSRGKLPKTRRAIDWVLACIVRLPMIAIILTILAAIIFALLLIFAPDIAREILAFLQK